MKTHILLSDSILSTQFCASAEILCQEFGHHVMKTNIRGLSQEEILNIINHDRNVILEFNKNVPIANYKANSNVLFVNRSPLDAQNSLFLDDNGYGANSHVVAKNINKYQANDYIYQNIKDTYQPLGFNFETRKLRENAIFIYLEGNDFDKIILDACAEHLPKDAYITVIAHPQNRDKLIQIYGLYLDRFANFDLFCDEITDTVLSRCTAIILRNNNICFRAMAMGIKVLAFDGGLYTASKAVCEYNQQNYKISSILAFHFTQESVINLFTNIHMSCIPIDASRNNLYYNSNFINYCSRMIV